MAQSKGGRQIEATARRGAWRFVRSAVLGLGIGLLVGSLVLAPSALARPHAAVSWSLPRTANEGAAIPFTWTGRHLGRDHRLVIQKPEGTAHTWRTIGRLPKNSGSGELNPGLPLGRYRFRIADLVGWHVLAWQVAGVGVFGQVALSTLMAREPEVIAIPRASFSSVLYWEGEDDSNPIFTVEHNHCKSVHIAFVPGYPDPNTNTPGSITLVQESREPITASTPRATIGSLDAELVVGQSWAVNGQPPENINLNGYAVCDSTEPFSS